MTGWVVVFSGDEEAAAAALEALGGAGIEAASTGGEVAVPRGLALEAAHVLRSERLGLGEPEDRGRSRRPLLALVAAVVIVAMVLLAVLVLIPGAGR